MAQTASRPARVAASTVCGALSLRSSSVVSREVLHLLRDHAGWAETVAYVESLPDSPAGSKRNRRHERRLTGVVFFAQVALDQETVLRRFIGHRIISGDGGEQLLLAPEGFNEGAVVQPVIVEFEELPDRRGYHHHTAENRGKDAGTPWILHRPKIHYRNGGAGEDRGNFRRIEKLLIQPRPLVVPFFLRLEPALDVVKLCAHVILRGLMIVTFAPRWRSFAWKSDVPPGPSPVGFSSHTSSA